MRHAFASAAFFAYALALPTRAVAFDGASGSPSGAPSSAAASSAAPSSAAALDEAPPPAPRKTGVVVESSLGALGFAGHFKSIAPPGVWLSSDAGYEIF